VIKIFPVIAGGYYSYLFLPFPTVGKYTAALPSEMLKNFGFKFHFLGIVMNIFVFILSFYIVFERKTNFKKWWIIFTIFNCLLIFLFTNLESFLGF